MSTSMPGEERAWLELVNGSQHFSTTVICSSLNCTETCFEGSGLKRDEGHMILKFFAM